jgi:hypothetical protein
MHTFLDVCHRYAKLQHDTDVREVAKGENAFEVQDAVEVQRPEQFGARNATVEVNHLTAITPWPQH